MRAFLLLIRSAIRTKYRNFIKLGFLSVISVTFMVCSVTLYTSGASYVSERMQTLGYGDVTVWTADAPRELAEDVLRTSAVSEMTVQPLIYAGYQIEGKYSDSEGEIMTLVEEIPYRMTDIHGKEISKRDIKPGEIYISPALASSFDVKMGTVIHFEYSRTDKPVAFTVCGYFEDPFMGSSMIDMKSFLISTSDYERLSEKIIETKEADRLARSGSMLHISAVENMETGAVLKNIMEETELSRYTEFAYTRESILNFMLLLQNILCAFLGAFALLIFIMSVIVGIKNLSDTVEEESDDLGTLRMIGASGKTLRLIYLFVFLGAFFIGSIIAVPLGVVLAKALAVPLVTSTGLLVPIHVPVYIIAAVCICVLLMQTMFMVFKTKRLLRIRPIPADRRSMGKFGKLPKIKRPLAFSFALREVVTGKRKYIGLFVMAVLLTFFLSVIGRMTTWLGPNGEGLMNAFSVAEHDLGVQPFNADVPMDEIERVISWYSPILTTYEIAMQPVYVNGREYTANVLNDISYFHVLRGNVCDRDEILITDTVADELDIGIGDRVQITGVGRTEDYVVSGIYMCANGMGSNIGMSLAGYSKIGDINRYIWCHHYILENGDIREYAANFLWDNYRGIDVHTNSWSGLDGIVGLMHRLSVMIYLVSALFIALTVSLVSRSLIRSEMGTLAIYKTLGMRGKDVRRSFALRFMIVVTAGCILGLILSGIAADRLIGNVFLLAGIGEFHVRAPVLGNLIPFLTLPLTFFLFAFIAGRKANRISIITNIQKDI